ncbi:MAG: RHS repeat domain-containing protein [Algibacter sp.]
MNMRLFFFMFLFFITKLFFGQEELPEIFPPSPTASELGKYGSYPVNLASGLPNIEIPLYTVVSGDIQIPIKLKYHASGIKVNQTSSWVGLGWALETGGLISLETRDSPDELEPDPYTIPNVTTLTNIMNANPWNFNQVDIANAVKYSWVKDAYHISLPTVGGTFFLDSDNDGEVTTKFPPDEFKIYRSKTLANGHDYLYKVIDKQGIQYEFKDYEQSQINKTSNNVTHIHNTPYKSAWLLSKIRNTKGDSLTYNYGTQYTNAKYGESHSQSHSATQTVSNNNGTSTTKTINSWQKGASSSITFGNKIQDILFLNGRARFIVGSNNDFLDGDGVSGYFLEKIIIEQGDIISGYTEIKNIHFEYSTTGDPTYFSSSNSNKYRFKLDRVYETYGSINEKEIVNLEYSSVQLPEIRSYAMDYFGNFNGKNNTNLIIKQSINFQGDVFEIGKADRSISLAKMQAGMLTKIKYPTKGYTKFEYEPNSFYGVDPFTKDQSITEYLNLFGTGDAANTPYYTEEGEPDYQTSLQSFSINKGTQLSITGSISCDNCNPTNSKYKYANITVLNNGIEKLNLTNYYSNSLLEIISLDPGTVKVILSVYGSVVEAHIVSSYFKSANTFDENVQGFGLRIKNITNYDYDDSFLNQKAYLYNIPNTTNSSGKLVNVSSNYDRYSDFQYYNVQSCFPIASYSNTMTYTYGASSTTGFENNGITYQYVTEIEKDSLENTKGKTDYTYTITPDYLVDDNHGSIRVNSNYKRGQLLKKEVYNGQDKLLIEEENFYSEDLNKSNNRQDFKMYNHGDSNLTADPGCLTPELSLNQTKELLSSDVPVYWYKKDKTDVTQYFYNSSGTLIDQLITSTDYTYNSLNQEVQKTVTANSKEQILETSYKYAHDLNDTRLIADNRISIPLETKTLENTQIINHSKTQFDDSELLYLPKEVFSKKGALVDINNSDDRKYTFDSYENGKITQYHIENGITTSIIWGYNEQYPIAKIENADYSQVSSQVSNLQTLSSQDNDHCLDSENCNEKNLRTALTTLRNSLPETMVTTYTYDPLIGVTSVTDPKGYTMYYEYDDFNRLKQVKDADGNILSKNEYNYKQ